MVDPNILEVVTESLFLHLSRIQQLTASIILRHLQNCDEYNNARLTKFDSFLGAHLVRPANTNK